MLTPDQVLHLEVLENGSFSPIGWLYQGIYHNLASEGLCHDYYCGSYVLTEYGRKMLKEYRNV